MKHDSLKKMYKKDMEMYGAAAYKLWEYQTKTSVWFPIGSVGPFWIEHYAYRRIIPVTVITKDEKDRIVTVTEQDEEGRVVRVLSESTTCSGKDIEWPEGATTASVEFFSDGLSVSKRTLVNPNAPKSVDWDKMDLFVFHYFDPNMSPLPSLWIPHNINKVSPRNPLPEGLEVSVIYNSDIRFTGPSEEVTWSTVKFFRIINTAKGYKV